MIDEDRIYFLDEALPLMGKKRTSFYDGVKAARIEALKIGRRTGVTGKEILRVRGTYPIIGRRDPKFEHTDEAEPKSASSKNSGGQIDV